MRLRHLQHPSRSSQFHFLSNCSGSAPGSRKSGKDTKSDATNDSGPAVTGGRNLEDCNLNPCTAENSKVQTTGANLVGFESIRNRCDFSNNGISAYDITCRPVAVQPNAIEVPVTAAILPASITLAWAAPTVLQGTVASAPVCTLDAVNLTQKCSVKSTTIGNATTVGFSLAVTNVTSSAVRKEPAEVTLVGSVSVGWGHVTNSGLGTIAGGGFSPLKFDALGDGKGLLIEPGSVCSDGESTFYTNTNSIWELRKDGGVYIFAGGPGLRPTPEDFSHRLRLRLDAEISIACGKNYLVVTEAKQHRILAIPRTGPVVVVVGKVADNGSPVAGFSGDGGLAKNAMLNFAHPISRDLDFSETFEPSETTNLFGPRGVAVVSGSNGDTIFFADTGNHRIRKIDPNGIISTVIVTGQDVLAADGSYDLPATLGRPQHLAIAPNGNIYFTSIGVVQDSQVPPTNRYFAWLRMIDTKGTISTVLGLDQSLSPSLAGAALALQDPSFDGSLPIISVAVAKDNAVFVGVSQTLNVVKVVNGVMSLVFDERAEKNYAGILSYVLPYGLSVDPTGNLGLPQNLWVQIRQFPITIQL